MSMAILLAMAPSAFHKTKNVKDTKYTVRRPTVSEKEDHQRGATDIASMYRAAERLAIDGLVLRSIEIS